jgi:hypothetical protein
MRIQCKLQRIFEQNENLAHFLNYKAQAFFTQRRGPKKIAPLRHCVNKKKNVSPSAAADWTGSKEGKPRRSIPLCGFASLRLCVNKKKECLPDRRGGLDRQQRREAAKKIPLCGLVPLREINKKTLAKEDSL